MILQASVIIPTYKRPQLLCDTIKSIEKQKIYGSFEIIVVDNSHSIELCKHINDLVTSERGNPYLRYIAEPCTGLHYARHTGALSAKADIIVFCDDDILVRENWLSALLTPFENPLVVCVGGKILPHWETTPPSWINVVPEGYYSLLDYGEIQHFMKNEEWFNGGNFAIRKKTLFELGGFNPDGFGDRKLRWFRGDGEYGLMRKLKKNNYLVMHVPEAITEHRITKERMTVEYLDHRAFNFGIESSYSYYRYKKPSYIRLCFRIPRIIAGYLKYQFLNVKNGNKVDNYLRYRLRKETYRGSLLHTLRLLTQKELRKHCRRENYLDENC